MLDGTSDGSSPRRRRVSDERAQGRAMSMMFEKARKIASWLRDGLGLTALDYLLIVCLIAVVAFAMWSY
jgi:hypothetical protein